MCARQSLDVFGDVSRPCTELSAQDSALAVALDAIKTPVIRKRKGEFTGLFRIIVAQQVSVPSAEAIWERCREGVTPMSAKQVCVLGEDELRRLGLTRQKAHYIYCIAEAIRTRQFSFKGITALSNEAAREHLTQLKGVGPWSAGIYLLFCEGRIDIWPPGDVALEHAYGRAAGFAKKPTSDELNKIAENWAPWRGLAAHILWTYYAHIRGRKPI